MKSLFDFVSEFQPERQTMWDGLLQSTERVQQYPDRIKRIEDLIPDALRVMANKKHGFMKACNLALDAVRDNPDINPETAMTTVLFVGMYNTIPPDASPSFGWLPQALETMDHEFPLQSAIGGRAANMVCEMLDDVSVKRPVELVLRGEMLIGKIYPLDSIRRTEAFSRIILAVRSDLASSAPPPLVTDALKYVAMDADPGSLAKRNAETMLKERAFYRKSLAENMETRAIDAAVKELSARMKTSLIGTLPNYANENQPHL